MSAVLLAVFDDYEKAERLRTDLVLDGFPTDRVELTACRELGRAGYEPADSLHEKFRLYFRTLLKQEDEQEPMERVDEWVEHLAECVDRGGAAITIHPRGTIETARATEMIQSAGPIEVLHHDLANQAFEHAAAEHDTPWIRHLWIEGNWKSDCIYCNLFES